MFCRSFDVARCCSTVSVAIRERGGYALMPEWGTRPANQYLPRKITELIAEVEATL